MNIIVKAAAVAFIAVGSVGAASATTVTFDNIDDDLYGLGLPYVENGVTVASTDPGGGILGSFVFPSSLHIDDSPAGFTQGAMFTTGGVFDVLGFSFTSLGYSFYGEAPEVVGNIIIRGFLDGAQVVRDRITMSPVFGTVQDIVLGAGFLGLDAFSIEMTYPATEVYCDVPCGHIDLDSVTFGGIAPVPVPLPASGLMLGAAALGLAGFGRRRKRA